MGGVSPLLKRSAHPLPIGGMNLSTLLRVAQLNLPGPEAYERIIKRMIPPYSPREITPLLRFYSVTSNRIVFYPMAEYPKRLLDLENPPFHLSYNSTLPQKEERIITLAGSRSCDFEGLQAAFILGKALAEAGFTLLVSNSRGFDRWARLGSQSANKASYVNCDCGLGTKRITYDRSLEGEKLISAFLPFEEVTPIRCLSRNVLSAALSDVTIIGPAPSDSGALHVASWALDLGKEVLVHPSGVGPKKTQMGSSFLHQSGAHLFGGGDLPSKGVI